MKILVVNGSPKKENSNTLCLTKAFIEGIECQDVEYLTIASLNINPCLGCFKCWTSNAPSCVLKDDMDSIISKIVKADLIIWSFPLYYYNVPGILKNFIDRLLPMNEPFMDKEKQTGGHPPRHDLRHQKHVLISTCGFWTAKGNYDSIVPMFNHFLPNNDYLKIFCGQGELFKIPQLRMFTNQYLEIVRRCGYEFINNSIKDDTIESLNNPLFSKEEFEKMADGSWGK